MANDPLRPEAGFDAPLQEYLDSTKVDMDKLKGILEVAKREAADAEAAYKAILAKFEALIGKIKG